jgi:asparagine synthase (glutamine-hydrolysing)
MCGICGIYDKDQIKISEVRIIKMRDMMYSRGPDDAGVYVNKHIGLGHRRLSIIDLSEKGRQPMSNEDNTILLVLNGEVYNFMELREKLIRVGHAFKSKTDSEVIVHGYEEWGECVFEKINGMFAIAIWDSRKQILILARDRVGKKPLFYAESGGKVIFASDIKSVMEGMDKVPEIDCKAVDAFLVHLCVSHPLTIFKEIKKVLPAHYIIFSENDTKIKRYWHLNFRSKMSMKEDEYLEKILELLKISVRDRLVSNVPSGAFLSGGVDSSLIVALMSELSSRRVNTFSVGFEYQPYNEARFAKNVADKYNTNHQQLFIKPADLNILPKLVWSYGEPFADSSAIPSYYVSKTAREHVKVVFLGDGGDDSFAGYDRTEIIYRACLYRKIVPRFLSNFVILPFFKITGGRIDRFYIANRVKFYEKYLSDTIRVRYKNLMGWIETRNKLYSDGFKKTLNGYDSCNIYESYFDMENSVHEIDRALFTDINTILPDDYLVKMDVSASSNSLETRAPFLDYRLMEFAAGIPPFLKLKKGNTKYLLKKLAEKYIPKENIYRPKLGFGVPIGVWFRKELKPYLYSVVLSEKAKKRNYFNYEYVEYIINEHLAGRGYHEHKLWSLLWFELWHRMFIDGDLKPTNSLKDLV